MNKKLLLIIISGLSLLSSGFAVHAQSTPAKKALVARILKLQQPGIEGVARTLAERPALDMLDRAGAALTTRVAADKREAVGKEIQADVKKYLDEAVPLVRDRAVKLAPTTIGAVLEEKFNETELKSLADFLESPAYIRFQQLGNDMQKSLVEKLLTDTRGLVEPKINALDQTVAKRLGITAPPAGAAGATPAK
ncbi:MAG: hypothetical protein H7228_05620 [Polaromonas sp.]|nr:hypothetical protein [Polaromonas sp.]